MTLTDPSAAVLLVGLVLTPGWLGVADPLHAWSSPAVAVREDVEAGRGAPSDRTATSPPA